MKLKTSFLAALSLSVSALAQAQESDETTSAASPPPVEEKASAPSPPSEEASPPDSTQSEAPQTSQQPTEPQAGAPETDAAPPQEEAKQPPVEETEKAEASKAGELAPLAQPEEKEPEPYNGPATILGRDDGKLHVGGYGGVSVHGTSINKSAGVLVGAEGALLLDHRFAIGLGGFGLSSEVTGPDFAQGEESILGFGYGGAIFRYHLMSKRSPVTFSVGTLIGAGGLTLVKKLGDDEYDYEEETPANAFFVVEPAAQVNLHLTRWMRVGVSGGYRFVRGPDLGEIADRDLEGVSAGGHIQFGWF